MTKPLRAAMIGCGRIARRHAAVLTALEGVHLAGCCDHKAENAAAFSQEFGGIRAYTDCEAMFAELGLDIVYICLPPFAHGNEVYLAQDNLFHRQMADYTIEDASATVIRFDSGSLAVIAATNGAIPGRWESEWRVVQQNLTVDFSDSNHAVIWHTDQSPVATKVIAAETDLFRAQALDLLAAIRD